MRVIPLLLALSLAIASGTGVGATPQKQQVTHGRNLMKITPLSALQYLQ